MTSAGTETTFAPTVLTQQQYVLLHGILRWLETDGTLEPEALNALRPLLQGEDVTGRRWTYDLETSLWARTDITPWKTGVPRGPLLVAMPAELLEDLRPFLDDVETIKEALRDDQTRAPGKHCATCHAPLSSNSRFCPACGSRQPDTAPVGAGRAAISGFCTNCGQRITSGQNFCPSCGADQRGTTSARLE
jgi:RNA polymerase subunit RPABC4/transcription elongation factor Spt4